MIDPHWVLEDLDPRTWLAIGRFFMPDQYIAAAQPGEHGLFVLHDAGRRPRVVDSELGVRTDLVLARVDDPSALAHELYARREWDRVHVIDKRHLANVSRTAQASPRRELTLDAYYHLVYNLIWDGSDGYVALPAQPGTWHGWTYSGVANFLKGLPTPAAIGLCVVDGDIGLVLRVDDGRITRVTTFEGLPALADPIAVTNEFAAALWAAMVSVAPPAAALVCTAQAFEALLMAPDKHTSLAAAVRSGAALVRSS